MTAYERGREIGKRYRRDACAQADRGSRELVAMQRLARTLVRTLTTPGDRAYALGILRGLRQ